MSVGTQTGHLTQTWERIDRLLCHPNLKKKREELSSQRGERRNHLGEQELPVQKLGRVKGNMIKLETTYNFPNLPKVPFPPLL